jgi:hypothetical protein
MLKANQKEVHIRVTESSNLFRDNSSQGYPSF